MQSQTVLALEYMPKLRDCCAYLQGCCGALGWRVPHHHCKNAFAPCDTKPSTVCYCRYLEIKNWGNLFCQHTQTVFEPSFDEFECLISGRCSVQTHACHGAWLANWQEWSYFNSFSALKAHSASLLGIVFPHFISVLRSLKQMMLARRIFCSIKYYNLILVSTSHLEEEAKINPSTISSDVFIWKLKANANCRGEVTWRYQMITSCFSWVPSQLFRIYQESA